MATAESRMVRSLASRTVGNPRVERVVTRFAERAIQRFCPTARNTFFDPRDFPWIAGIEANWLAIRRELDAVMRNIDEVRAFNEISTSQRAIAPGRNWKTFFFRTYSAWAEENCARCPETARLLKSIPGIQTAFFSIFDGGTHLPEHRGDFKGVLRYHLGLIVPEPASSCGIRVGQDTRHWAEGKSMVFDDSNPHEAWNHTAHPRVVLFLDFIRPLPFPLSLLNRFAILVQSHTPFGDEMRANQNKKATPPAPGLPA
ncbi:MAG: aspartyl/asparaginyl beta-hydroxylase domain-containing protein [Alphaproteobacteria bacterium]|nr:aspartyl/asparaginyl beta-hydroxylase domain-containing protein [Alphaproteobacteria bacterium]